MRRLALILPVVVALAACSVQPDPLGEGEGEAVGDVGGGDGAVADGGGADAAGGVGAGAVPGGCAGDGDCDRGLYCIAGGCRERACEPATRRCAGAEEIEVCDALGAAWAFRRACDRGCAAGACEPAVCPPGAVRCAGEDGGEVERCDAVGGQWFSSGACDLGCVAGECRRPTLVGGGGDGAGDGGGGEPVLVCDDGDRRCDGDSVFVCNEARTGWGFVQACDTACAAGACVVAACPAGRRRCSGVMLEQCDVRGLGWSVVTVCEGGCDVDDAECLPAAVDGGAGCPEAMRRCVGDALEVCAGRRWSLVEVCEAGCRGTDCVQTVCRPGDRRCDASGAEVEICSADGTQWRFRRACPTECQQGDCLPQVCQPFVRRCNGLLPQQCDPVGTAWIDGAPCQASCLDGVCDRVPDGGCLPARERCDGLSRQRCSQNFSWELVEDCDAACIGGECVPCRPNALRCSERGDRERCAQDGSGWDEEEVCAVTCIAAACTECIPGQRRCNGDVIEACEANGQGWSSASLCVTSCAVGACTACTPNALRCNGRSAERCRVDGSGWDVQQECGGRCVGGVCAGAAVCEPGLRRCDRADVQVCTPDAAGWLTLESCMATCEAGRCEGPACLPFRLSATPEQLPADGASSALIVSDRILDVHGTPVPDGTLFTIEVAGADVRTEDGDPNTAGIQVRSLNGRVDFAIGAPDEPGDVSVSAVHPVAGRCQGAIQLQAAPGGEPSVALDFTADALNDADNTTALWDTILGRVDPFPSDFGGGEDGALTVNGTYNINQHSQPGRLFPDAVNFSVVGLGDNSATVAGGVGGIDIGDEVLIINLQGTAAVHGNVGNFELLEVARIDYGLNTLYFTTSLRRAYGVADANDDLTGQQIMLQRVPHYTEVTLAGTLTANAWDGERGGVVFLKALGQVAVNSGSITADSLGYRAGGRRRGESYAGWPNDVTPSRNFGGGGVHTDERYSCGGGGGHATQARHTRNGDRGGEGGLAYGDEDLARWFLGSGGGGGRSNYGARNGGTAGGIVVVWAGGPAVRGVVTARGAASGGCWHGGPGAGGTIFLRGRSLNVGNNRVRANGDDYGGDNPQASDGRIRLDFFGLAGTTDPEHHPGFAGDTTVRTLALDHAVVPITEATLSRVVSDERGGRLTYEITNNGVQWFEVAPGASVDFGDAVGNDLQLRVSFTNDNLQPLTLNGIVLTYSEADP